METRRLILFLVVSFGFILIWQNFVLDRMRQPVPQNVAEIVPVDDEIAPEINSNEAEPAENKVADAVEAEVLNGTETAGPVLHERRQVVLGSLDPQGGYAIEAEFSTEGASVTSVRLSDPKMKDLINSSEQVQVIGHNRTGENTFSTSLDVIDRQLDKHSPGMRLETVDWKVAEQQADAVVFEYVAPDQSVEIKKTYRIHPLSVGPSTMTDVLRTDPAAYTIRCELAISNLSKTPQKLQYEILGPCGVILENEEHTRKYRDIKLEFIEDGSSAQFSASEVQSVWEEQRVRHPQRTRHQISEVIREGENKWIEPVRYAGIDVQFFAALIAPMDDRPLEQQASDQWVDRIWPELLRESKTATLADITFRMASRPRTLEPNTSITHEYAMFVGPKHGALLDPPPFQAEKVLDYGSYFGFIARGMHSVLSFLYGIHLPYWLAIISLTVMVRCCLFPLSRKQALSAARMKELQPKINELKLKYGEDKEKMAKAQMELWRKHNINPLGGCLPLFFQLPVFIGLYTCLNTAVDLRLSSFLWIENLAAPDELFQMPFSLPFLGKDFNLLPCINVVLFLVQQKLFMPPPTDEQQEMQHKMMNVMTIFFAVMFWHVPAGLCIYFVASSLWSIGERKLLGSDVLAKKDVAPEENKSVKPSGKRERKRKAGAPDADATRPKGFLERLMAAAEQAKNQAEQNRSVGHDRKNAKRGKQDRRR
ncbi:MAG: YidC/Oxa1 family insertase periplasmic-domain containing protein [Fuerstiella sp.]|nr:YidC/Oxa1 family insertase periplasmic-domain containing protein [Fuerstiella sp.]